MKIYTVAAELFHADGRTDGDTTKLLVDFRNFANALKTTLARHLSNTLAPTDLPTDRLTDRLTDRPTDWPTG